mmetsp:Transcript_4741/g.18966  ORF Transcript_4741/g.18966 Transcript_4741/m.18966 type:complete len:81 (+) Transcript_4741:1228-1470(+)
MCSGSTSVNGMIVDSQPPPPPPPPPPQARPGSPRNATRFDKQLLSPPDLPYLRKSSPLKGGEVNVRSFEDPHEASVTPHR